ncbi:MAG: hypothetical protein F4Y53_02585 [Proteobacteria bacterium]|nr:hypothetical protein [Pseudomonadota bacterium]
MTAGNPKPGHSGTVPSLEVAVHESTDPSMDDSALLTHVHFGNSGQRQAKEWSINSGLEVLQGSDFHFQNWYTSGQVRHGKHANIQYMGHPQVLFGHLQLDCLDSSDFQALAMQAYQEIYDCLQSTACNHLLRTWNYFPGITDPAGNQSSRYDLFCSGRLQAMQACNAESSIYPAATVIGNQNPYLQIYFLAGDVPGIAVENPRQTSAYDYPIANVQAPPLFSRGVLKHWSNCTHFYVSGTASIVGHETRHVDDVGAQLNESLNNVETLVVHANHRHRTQLNAQDDLLCMKVYVRHRRDVPHIQRVLAARLPSTTPRILLLGDMCRTDLLVEIEALYQS